MGYRESDPEVLDGAEPSAAEDDEECWHAGVECEVNGGEDACHCPCNNCDYLEDEEPMDDDDPDDVNAHIADARRRRPNGN